MRKLGDEVIFSATDVVNFLECEHLTSLDRINLEAPLERSPEDPTMRLIQEHGTRHEQQYLASLHDGGKTIVDVSEQGAGLDHQVAATRQALADGPEVVYQAALRDGVFAGYADFLERVDRPSDLGAFSYEVVDTKLSKSPKAKYLVQLAFYSSILAKWQGRMPEAMHVVLGDGTRLTYRVADYIRYYYTLQARFLEAQLRDTNATYPAPCAKCAQCSWSGLCEQVWERDDHLSRVANIRQAQVNKLNAAGINTLQALANVGDGHHVPKLASETLSVLRHQARLQWQERVTGKRVVDLLPATKGDGRGFQRLPPADEGDLYFDMEGDPLEKNGLEYLFGVGYRKPDGFVFVPFWGHNREQEKVAFEAFIDFVVDHLARHPNAHIYHYAAYEKTALGKLMSLHGTRERQVDDLFRHGRLVDLYKVVRESMRVSEPGYSIKNIERFYRPPREGEVKNAGASIVFYEQWRQSADPVLLSQIEAYNRDDVESTAGLHQWLLSLRPQESMWRASSSSMASEPRAEEAGESVEDRLARVRQALIGAAGSVADANGAIEPTRLITAQLIDFHRREQKPQWWKMFDCLQMDLQELVEDHECIGGMELDPACPPFPEKQSLVYSYVYPEQETKLRTGSQGTRIDSGKAITLFSVDHDERVVCIKVGKRSDPPPAAMSIGPGPPVDDKALRARVESFAGSVIADDDRFLAVKRLLAKELPAVEGVENGSALVDSDAPLSDVIRIVAAMQQSHLVVQGPPGAGKTYTGSHVIVDLIKRGKTVGVASNSHKAIHNLLEGVVDVAREQGVAFRGFKKKSSSNPDSHFASDAFDNGDKLTEYDPRQHRIFAGTAWAFAGLPDDTQLDYLFIDEAGQVSLGNLIAMGVSARNIVLLGDQMQLGQPIQGVHPGRSGESILEYLLDGRATIPPAEGVFLSQTWRMHPAVCSFISDAVYDGRLHAAAGVERRHLVLTQDVHPSLAPVGVRYIPVAHSGRSQSCEEEASVISDLYVSLLKQEFVETDGARHTLGTENILVVSPYNLQVNLLKRFLPDGARVGTVDKFQGQEAAVVIVSMATSSSEELPRDIEFLYSKNRLNVAISRAKCLALVLASPDLMSIGCNTPEQMALVNTLCWVKDYSEAHGLTALAAQEGSP
ncbi:TM0106 family RecB-like putative nuclease [Stenotrophomonas lacuserhaii]|uniref:TM0106 family RecB-like putative nuclease n=1 Tax=Stenotrophomonas lacuserhaii TaxID=2760084 RepID=UPI0015FE75FE|nr:TM0106 family RecB-like putative nuclease [Stenotrophomonas lacuserhaii]